MGHKPVQMFVHNYSPLHLAAKRGHLGVCRLLLAANAGSSPNREPCTHGTTHASSCSHGAAAFGFMRQGQALGLGGQCSRVPGCMGIPKPQADHRECPQMRTLNYEQTKHARAAVA